MGQPPGDLNRVAHRVSMGPVLPTALACIPGKGAVLPSMSTSRLPCASHEASGHVAPACGRVEGHAPEAFDLVAGVPGLADLWDRTLGDPRVCVAILDGPVDLAHPSFQGADLSELDGGTGPVACQGAAWEHGTHIASVILGQHSGPVRGLAPRCRGISIPIFASAEGNRLRTCSQLDLARAISLAVQQGAQIINISGGQFSASGTGSPLLTQVVRDCGRRGVLIVAAAGNDGCACLHVPAALDFVLAVGAMDARGEPLAVSNWGVRYQTQGILAPGVAIAGARPGGGTRLGTGTSYATAVVSGIAALLLSLQRQGRALDPHRIRRALLQSAAGCAVQPVPDCRRLLAGRLDLQGASALLHHQDQGMFHMSDVLTTSTGNRDTSPQAGVIAPSDVERSDCGCSTGQKREAAPKLVYALGQLGYDLVSEARLDSLAQNMAGQAGSSVAERSRRV